MQVMQELPTNKPNFSFKHTEDFNQTTHVAPYGPIVFNDNISFYFNFLHSVQDVLKEYQMVTSQQFQYGSNFFPSFVAESIPKYKMHSFQQLFQHNGLHNSFPKMPTRGFCDILDQRKM